MRYFIKGIWFIEPNTFLFLNPLFNICADLWYDKFSKIDHAGGLKHD